MLVVILIALATITSTAQDLPAVTASHGAFAFPNREGTELIVLHEVPNAADFRAAICGGRVVSVRHLRQQTGAGMPRADRDVPEQFGRLVGTVFQALDPGARPDDTCFAAADAMMEKAELVLLRMRTRLEQCSTDERRRVRAVRNRGLKACRSIAARGGDATAVVVEYVRLEKDALASLIVLTAAGLITIDFPATYRGEGEDLWRVEDGGVFSPESLSVPFVVRRDRLYFIGVDWRGAEGNSLSLYSAAPGGYAQKVLADYWYRAPH